MVGRTPVTRWLGRLVRARYLRIIPVEFRHTFYLRAEILGCRGGDGWKPPARPKVEFTSSGLALCEHQHLLLFVQMSW